MGYWKYLFGGIKKSFNNFWEVKSLRNMFLFFIVGAIIIAIIDFGLYDGAE